ncbi:glyoxalase [Bacillus mangrovi]|uniref:Glyoxalase n=1 Tax=Metabacillus mangrovi TaxID=1491830 RepID=A0A7X2S6Z3_9BACI|nr:VOC family protein [Metabacillus mangrovi]MTH54783.1 glyoxalase [Metabacillus mangrovi]
MIHQRISLLTVGAVNVKDLRSFYQKLGWEETESSSDEYAVFKTAGVLLSIYPQEELERDSGLQFSAGGYKAISFSINVNEPQEVDQAMEGIREAGAEIIKEPHEAFWGGRIAYFADPEKNLWEIAWNPSSVFDERGAMLDF